MTPSPTPHRLTPERLREIADDVEHRYSAWTATVADELRAHAAYLETLERQPTEEQIKYMRDRFLNWTLPQDLNPDGGISYKRSDSAIKYNHPGPTGTNFLNAEQAEAMVRYMIDGLPKPPEAR